MGPDHPTPYWVDFSVFYDFWNFEFNFRRYRALSWERTDGKIIILGGWVSSDGYHPAQDTVEVVDIASNSSAIIEGFEFPYSNR